MAECGGLRHHRESSEHDRDAAPSREIDPRSPGSRSAAGQLGAELRRYARPRTGRSIFELTVTVVPFVILWGIIWAAFRNDWYFAVVLVVPASGLLVRLFVIQHDCGHGSYFRTRRSNDWLGHCLGVLTLTPYSVWKHAHARHHATSGNLGKRGIGDIDTLTVREFRSLSRWRRCLYRLYRHPTIMFGIGPAYLFILRHRLPVGQMTRGWQPWASAMLTNAAAAGAFIALSMLLGLGSVVAVHLPIVALAASSGVWLFFVQHQFEETHWADDGEWNFHTAALHGSSFYALPRLLHWFSGNIGYHHIHHLVSRIPFYRLPEVMRDHSQLREIGRVTVGESLSGVGLALWDEELAQLISFRTANRDCSDRSINRTPRTMRG